MQQFYKQNNYEELQISSTHTFCVKQDALILRAEILNAPMFVDQSVLYRCSRKFFSTARLINLRETIVGGSPGCKISKIASDIESIARSTFLEAASV